MLFGIRVFLSTNLNELKNIIKYICYKSKIEHPTDNYPALCHHFRLPYRQHLKQVADLIFHLDLSYQVGNIQYHFLRDSYESSLVFRIFNSRIIIRKFYIDI